MRCTVICSMTCIKTTVCLILLGTLVTVIKDIFLENRINRFYLQATGKVINDQLIQSCKIPEFDIYHYSIKKLLPKGTIDKCDDSELFTYIHEKYLFIDKTKKPQNVLYCRYVSISKKEGHHHGFSLTTESEKFTDKTKVSDEFIQVNCYSSADVQTHVNFHYIYQHSPRKNTNQSIKKPNVILLVFDSVSRANSIRYLPKTRNLLFENLGAIEMKGYSKVGRNSFPNLITLLTGKFENELNLSSNYADHFPLIWSDFSSQGYKTFFQEDGNYLGLFDDDTSKKLKGFRRQPTDVFDRYFQKAIKAMKSKFRQNKYKCIGGQHDTERMYNDIIQFVANTQDPYFIFSDHVSYSHEQLQDVAILDDKTVLLFNNLQRLGHLDNTLLVLFADHGFRRPPFMHTSIGWMENRLPMMYIYLPSKFKSNFKTFSNNLKVNSERLVTLFDLHATLQHLLILHNGSYYNQRNNPKGMSLFKKIPLDRNCIQANIVDSFCVCNHYVENLTL